MVEYSTLNRDVVGSSPTAPTNLCRFASARDGSSPRATPSNAGYLRPFRKRGSTGKATSS